MLGTATGPLSRNGGERERGLSTTIHQRWLCPLPTLPRAGRGLPRMSRLTSPTGKAVSGARTEPDGASARPQQQVDAGGDIGPALDIGNRIDAEQAADLMEAAQHADELLGEPVGFRLGERSRQAITRS